MLSSIRKHLNPGTATALVALVFAMSGGAFAATGGLGSPGGHDGTAVAGVAKVKKRSKATGKAGPRGPQGKQGPQGLEGPAGKEGPSGPEGKEGKQGLRGKEGEGKEGPAGQPGTNGKEGETVTVTTLAQGSAGCPEGGAEFSDSSGSATACNGKSAGGTLEPEGVEQGLWSMQSNPANSGFKIPEQKYDFAETEAIISFPEPLPGEDFDRVSIHYVPLSVEHTEACPGAKAEESVPGTLCVYGVTEKPSLVAEFEFELSALKPVSGYYLGGITEGMFKPGPRSHGSHEQIGARLTFAQLLEESESPGIYANGIWILTAPEEA